MVIIFGFVKLYLKSPLSNSRVVSLILCALAKLLRPSNSTYFIVSYTIANAASWPNLFKFIHQISLMCESTVKAHLISLFVNQVDLFLWIMLEIKEFPLGPEVVLLQGLVPWQAGVGRCSVEYVLK